MVDLTQVPDERLGQTLRLMKAEIIKHGWAATIPYIGSSHCFIDRGDGKILHAFSATPPTTSYAAAHMANDKFATYQLLKTIDAPQLESILVDDNTPFEEQVAFMNSMGTIVAKPVDGGHGNGITVGIQTPEKLQKALAVAKSEQKNIKATLLQKQYLHEDIHDIRIAVIDYKFVAATWRVAARVYGDGKRTIRELIERENSTEERGKPYFARLAVIDMARAEDYLGERIDTVPEKEEEVAVLGIANYGAGGEIIDITDDIPLWLRELAEQAARTTSLPVVGVDFMLATRPSSKATFDELDPAITEVNKCPALSIHDLPTTGKSRGAMATYVNYLATL